MEKKRSIGVTIFGWYFIVSAIIYFLTILLSVLSELPINGAKWNIFTLIIWIGAIFLGRGLLNLKEWARKFAVWWFGLFCISIPIAYLVGVKIISFDPYPVIKAI